MMLLARLTPSANFPAIVIKEVAIRALLPRVWLISNFLEREVSTRVLVVMCNDTVYTE